MSPIAILALKLDMHNHALLCVCHSLRLLEEESAKRAELEQIHLQQQRVMSQTQAEKQELESEQLAKEQALQAAMLQLESLERERQGALAQYQVREPPPPGPVNHSCHREDHVSLACVVDMPFRVFVIVHINKFLNVFFF